jgi:uncharacterized protein YodC (DUF2158 family)
MQAQFSRGDVVQRKSGGVAGTIEELYTVGGRLKATVVWHGNVRYHSGRTDQRSHILCSSLVPARLATPEQLAELDQAARALGYTGYGPPPYMTAQRAAQRLTDFAAGRVKPYQPRPVEPYAGLVLNPIRSHRR